MVKLFKNKSLFTSVNDFILCPVFRNGNGRGLEFDDIKDAFRSRLITLLFDATRELRHAITAEGSGEDTEDLDTRVYKGVCDQINDALELDIPVEAGTIFEIAEKIRKTDVAETFLRKLKVRYDEIINSDKSFIAVKADKEPETAEDQEYYDEIASKVEDADLAIFLEALRGEVTR